MNAKLKYSTLKILFENLYFHKGLLKKFLNNKELLQNEVNNMIHDNIISYNILNKDFLNSYDNAIKDLQQFINIKFQN